MNDKKTLEETDKGESRTMKTDKHGYLPGQEPYKLSVYDTTVEVHINPCLDDDDFRLANEVAFRKALRLL